MLRSVHLSVCVLSCIPLFYNCMCVECAECRRPGHICDPVTGECVCPPLTEGSACERCQANTWGHDPLTGCKVLQCINDAYIIHDTF